MLICLVGVVQTTMAQMETEQAGLAEFKESQKFRFVQYETSIYWLKKAVEKGNSDAMVELGNAYYKGYGGNTQTNFAEAQKYWQMAADKNNSFGFFNIGILYLYGQGVKKNIPEVIKLWTKAAELGHVKAMYSLGDLYFNKVHQPREVSKAEYWYQMALDNGEAEVIPKLAQASKMVDAELVLQKVGISDFEKGKAYFDLENYNDALKWFEKSAKSGNDQAMVALGLTYENLKTYRWADDAVNWFKKASNKGNSKGMYHIGRLILSGKYNYKGVVDYPAAMKWFQKAADLMDEDAMISAGWMYYDGTHDLKPTVNYNSKGRQHWKAWEIFMKAADLGQPDAYYCLGYMLDNGYAFIKDGKSVNFEQAGEWYQKAVDLGVERAKTNLIKFNIDFPIRKGEVLFRNKNYEEAKLWFDKADTENNDARAWMYLGEIFEKGLGVDKDLKKAFEYYYKSSNTGNLGAKIKVVELFNGDKKYEASIYKYKGDIKSYNEQALKNKLAMEEKIKKDKEDYQKWLFQKKQEELNRPSTYQSVWGGPIGVTQSSKSDQAYKIKNDYNNYVRYLDRSFGKVKGMY